MADPHPDYAEIARLERELGLVPATAPKPAPKPAPEPGRVPADALYVCAHCGNRVRAGALACNHCGGDTWRRDDD